MSIGLMRLSDELNDDHLCLLPCELLEQAEVVDQAEPVEVEILQVYWYLTDSG